MADHRPIVAAPVIALSVNELNILVIAWQAGQVIACVTFEDVVMHLNTGRAAALLDKDSVAIILEYIVIVGNGIVAGKNFLIHGRIKSFDDESPKCESLPIQNDTSIVSGIVVIAYQVRCIGAGACLVHRPGITQEGKIAQ